MISYQDSFVFEVNERIAPFEIYKRLGVGAVGEIFVAHRQDTGEAVAVKSLKEDTQDHLLIQRFRLEFDLLKKLDHPSVTQVYDYFDASRPFFTMEYIEGKTFRDEFDVRNMGEVIHPDRVTQLVDVTQQILHGLNYLHQNKVIHRDLKPENVMITPEGKVKLLDFGVARFQESKMALTQHQEVIGTLEYMAPEMLTGKNYDHRIDIYSLGVMLYRVITGKRMFEVYSFVDLFREKTTRESPQVSLDQLSDCEWLVEATNKMVARDPIQRYRSASEALGFFDLQHTKPKFEPREMQLGASPLLTIRNAPMVGRQQQFDQAREWMVSRSSQPALVSGTTGTGKSRFADAVTRMCLEDNMGAIVIQGQLLSQEEGSLLAAVVRFIGADRSDLIESAYRSATLTPRQVTQLLSQRWRSPGVIIIDDVHELRQDQVLELLDFFSSGDTTPGNNDYIWMLIMNRDHESAMSISGAGFVDLLPHKTHISINPLAAPEVSNLAQYLMEGHEVEQGLLSELSELSSGLPYSVANLLAVLLERELLVFRSGRWVFQREDEEATVQVNITHVLMRQYELLPPGARLLLSLLSCFGFKASLAVLLRASQMVESEFDTHLNELILQDFVALHQDVVVFVNSRLQRHAYDALDNDQRVEYHRQAMVALIEHVESKDDIRYLFSIIRHASVSGELAHVFRFSKEIALFFFDRDMYEEAQQYLGHAIAYYQGPPRLSLFEAYFWKGEAELCLYRLQEAGVDFKAALDVLTNVPVPNGEDPKRYTALLRRTVLHKLALIEIRKRRFANAQGLWQEIDQLMTPLTGMTRSRPTQSLAINDAAWSGIQQPSHVDTSEAAQFARLVFDTLLDLDEHGDYVGRLAKRWSWNADSRQLRFELEKGVKYHNGALLRADDICFAVRQMKQQSYFNAMLSDAARRIKTVETEDSNQVVVTYADDLPPNLMFWCQLMIVPSYAYAHNVDHVDLDPKSAMNGSGPFVVSSMDGTGKRLERVNKRANGLARLDLVASDGDTVKDLTRGQVDLAYMTLKRWRDLTPLVQVRDSVVRDFYVANKVFRLCFKMDRSGPFDREFRQAFYECQLLEYWVNSLLRNEYTAVNAVPLESQSRSGAPKTLRQANDKLIQLMLKRGYQLIGDLWVKDHEPFTFQFLMPDLPEMRKCLEAMAQHWSRLGFKLKIAWKPMSEYAKYRSHPKVNGWVDMTFVDPSYDGLADMLHSRSSANIIGYSSEKMDALLWQLECHPRQSRKQIILKINELFKEDLPWLPLFQPKTFYAFNADFGGLSPSMNGILSPPGGVDHVSMLGQNRSQVTY